MLAAITDQLREALQEDARAVPFPVAYGTEHPASGLAVESHIVLFVDRAAGDVFSSPTGLNRNPQHRANVAEGAVCRIYARSTKAGARERDHEALARAVRDQVIVALQVILGARKNGPWLPRTGRFLAAADVAEPTLQAWPGVVYEMKFTVDRSVLDTTYAGESADEATMGGTGGFDTSTTLDTSDSPDPAAGVPSATTRIEES